MRHVGHVTIAQGRAVFSSDIFDSLGHATTHFVDTPPAAAGLGIPILHQSSGYAMALLSLPPDKMESFAPKQTSFVEISQ